MEAGRILVFGIINLEKWFEIKDVPNRTEPAVFLRVKITRTHDPMNPGPQSPK
jgi:hypothetical protein